MKTATHGTHRRCRVLRRDEQETIIGRMSDEEHWQVYTCDRAVKARMLKLAEKHGLAVRRVDEYGIEVMVPKDWVKFRAPRVVSESQRERMRDLGKSHGFRVRREAGVPG